MSKIKKSNNTYNTSIIIFILIIFIQIIFINGLEKQLFYFLLKNKELERPDDNCKFDSTNDCYGMPSGHMEITTLIVLFCIYKFKLPVYIGCLIILIMGLQRYISKRHNLLQIISGILIASIYYYIYNYTNFSWISLCICLFFMFLYVIIIERIIHYKLTNDKIPQWVDKSMYKKIKEKINTPLWKKYITILFSLSAIYMNQTKLYISWNELENILDKTIKEIKKKNIKFDGIVGIKSGGAIASDYISDKLNIKNYKIKLSVKEYGCKNNAMIKNIIYYSLLNKKQEHIMCEEIKEDLRNKNLILIDELTYTGNTVISSINYLYNNKKVKYVYPLILTNFNFKKEHSNNKNNIYDINYIYNDYQIFCWSWGWDN